MIDGRLVHALPVIFVNDLPAQAKTLPGHKVFILGDHSCREVVRIEEKDITIYPLAIGSLRKLAVFYKNNVYENNITKQSTDMA